MGRWNRTWISSIWAYPFMTYSETFPQSIFTLYTQNQRKSVGFSNYVSFPENLLYFMSLLIKSCNFLLSQKNLSIQIFLAMHPLLFVRILNSNYSSWFRLIISIWRNQYRINTLTRKVGPKCLAYKAGSRRTAKATKESVYKRFNDILMTAFGKKFSFEDFAVSVGLWKHW